MSASALAGAAALHVLPVAALLTMGTPPAAALEEAAITLFVEPGGAPSAAGGAVASEPRPSPAVAAARDPQPDERPLSEAVPSPDAAESLPVPDFPPPPPDLRDAVPALEQRDAEVPDIRKTLPDLRDAVPTLEQRDAEAPDIRKTLPDLRDAVPTPEMREAAMPDFRPPSQPAKPQPRPEPRKAAPAPAPAPPPQKAEAKAPPAAAASATATPGTALPAPPNAATAHGGFASAAPPAAAPPGGAPSLASNWNALLSAWLAANRRYPEEARRRNVEGDVTVRFAVAADGRVTDVAITAGSGSSALDGAAVAMLLGARLPPPGSDVTRTVRIRYRLAN